MIEIKNLTASVDGNEILKGINLTVKRGEVHAIMGPNGSGKSTLSKVIAGHPAYEVTGGEVNFEINGKMQNLLKLNPSDRAKEGIFFGFQYPIEVPGVSNFTFLKESFNQICEHQGLEKMDDEMFMKHLRGKLKLLEMNESFHERSVN